MSLTKPQVPLLLTPFKTALFGTVKHTHNVSSVTVEVPLEQKFLTIRVIPGESVSSKFSLPTKKINVLPELLMTYVDYAMSPIIWMKTPTCVTSML